MRHGVARDKVFSPTRQIGSEERSESRGQTVGSLILQRSHLTRASLLSIRRAQDSRATRNGFSRRRNRFSKQVNLSHREIERPHNRRRCSYEIAASRAEATRGARLHRPDSVSLLKQLRKGEENELCGI